MSPAAQTTLPAIEPPPAVVEAARAAGVHRLVPAVGGRPALVGDCARCRRPVVWVDLERGTWRCWGCGENGRAP